MKVTIKDIAQKLNLNFSSVSRALNGKPGVSEETRKLIMRTAEEMGYRPNVIARGLVSSETRTLGIIMPDIINPIFGEITTAIIETANEFDYDVFLCISNWNQKKEIDYIHAVQEKQVDGIIAKSVGKKSAELLEKANVPVVGYETWLANSKFSSVSTDNERAGYLAANHLIECGYRNTAYIYGPENSSASVNRRNGFFKAFEDNSMDYNKDLMYTADYNIKSGYEMAKKLFREHPDTDSVLAGNDVMALGVLQYLEENNIVPGEEIGVMGFDDIDLSKLPQFQLSTVKQPKYSIGRIITKLLLDEMKNFSEGIQNYPQRILLEPELVARKTTRKI